MTTTGEEGGSIDARQQAIVDEFAAFDDWEERYRHLIKQGRSLPDYPEDHRNDEFKVKGCQSQVWLHPQLVDTGRGQCVRFDGDSDAALVRGLIALVLRVYSDATPDEIVATEPRFVADIGLADHLSPTRSNGLASMLKQIKLYGLAFKSLASR